MKGKLRSLPRRNFLPGKRCRTRRICRPETLYPPRFPVDGTSDAKTPGVNIAIYKSASALVALDRWQEAISQNISAASVPGFRKNEQAFASKVADVERFGAASGSVKEARGVMPTGVAGISMQPGEVRGTGNATDFAIQGSGFFKVQGDGGKTGYTRDGEFHVNAERTLVNKQGFPVLGDGGPITLKPEGGAISVSADGSIVQGDAAVGRLGVFEFKETDKLVRMGDGMLTPADPKVQPQLSQNPQLANGMLEMSNVQPLKEMVNMITVSRAYEANQRVIMSEDETLGKGIQALGSLSA